MPTVQRPLELDPAIQAVEVNGFTTEGDQQTKTRAALTYFTGGAGFA